MEQEKRNALLAADMDVGKNQEWDNGIIQDKETQTMQLYYTGQLVVDFFDEEEVVKYNQKVKNKKAG